MGGADATSVAAVLPYLIAVNIVVGLLIVYAVRAFRSGRWVEEQTHAHGDLQRQITDLKRQIDGLQAEIRAAMGDVKSSLAEEHKQRREFIDRIHEAFGALSLNHARQDERLKVLEKADK